MTSTAELTRPLRISTHLGERVLPEAPTTHLRGFCLEIFFSVTYSVIQFFANFGAFFSKVARRDTVWAPRPCFPLCKCKIYQGIRKCNPFFADGSLTDSKTALKSKRENFVFISNDP